MKKERTRLNRDPEARSPRGGGVYQVEACISGVYQVEACISVENDRNEKVENRNQKIWNYEIA